jgi:hypothetical protein
MAKTWRGLGAASGWLALGAVASSCVTVYEAEDAPEGRSQVPLPAAVAVPFPTGPAGAGGEGDGAHDRAHREYYGGLLRRLEDAVADRNPALLESLLEGFLRTDLPPWLRERLAAYRPVAKGLWFLGRVAATAHIEMETEAGVPLSAAAPPPRLGAPLRFVFTLPGGPVPVVFGGSRDADPTVFLVTLTIDDLFVDGTLRHQEVPEVVPLLERRTVRDGADLRLPIRLDLPSGGALRRTVGVRVESLTGHVQIDGVRVPLATAELAKLTLEQWPEGIEAIRKEPLATLREALRRGDPDHFAHVVLAAACLPAAAKQEAAAALIDVVRLGAPAQGQVAMFALQTLYGGGPKVGDRDAWLRYWQRQAEAPSTGR